MGPIKFSYTRHQLSSAYPGGIVDLQASLLSCMRSYQNIASAIKKYYVKKISLTKSGLKTMQKRKI